MTRDLTPALDWAASVAGPVAVVGELAGGTTSVLLRLRPTAGPDLVLRLMTEEPWRTHGAELTRRESDIQRMLAGSGLPVPESVALEATGSRCGHPAHLMTHLPGVVDCERVDGASLGRLAATLAAIHATQPSVDVRPYQSWAFEAKYVVPAWARDHHLWTQAFTLLRSPPPAYRPCFLHRDFQPRNVLWQGTEISGVVDWVETSIGPAWLDVAHCATNLAIRHGNGPAEEFARRYVQLTGRVPERYFEVMDVVGFLPPPGREGFLVAEAERRRLEERLRSVLSPRPARPSP